MNQQRLQKIIQDLNECIEDINECLEILSDNENNKIVIKLAKSSLRQLFVSYHTILEDFCSILLKELKKFKIGITLHESLLILKEESIINEELYLVLEKSRLMRNRISHRYKEPSFEDLYYYIKNNKEVMFSLLKITKKYSC